MLCLFLSCTSGHCSVDVQIKLCAFKYYTAGLHKILFAGLWSINLPRKVLFCSVVLTATLHLTSFLLVYC